MERLSNLLPETETGCYDCSLRPNYAYFHGRERKNSENQIEALK